MHRSRLSLATKWIIYQFLGIGLILSGVLAFQYVSICQQVYNEIEVAGESTLQMLEEMLADHPELLNERELDPLIDRFASRIASIYHVRVYDASLRLVADSNSETGGPLLDQALLSRLLQEGDALSLSYQHDDREFIRILHPMRGAYDPGRQSSLSSITVLDMHFSNAERRVREVLSETLLVFSILFLLFMAIQYGLMRFALLKPVGQLTSAAARFGRQDFSVRVPVKTSDELGSLAVTFNAMASALEEAHQGLTTEIAERKQAEIALLQQTTILQSILNSIGEGVVVADANGALILFNPAAERIFGQGIVDVAAPDWPQRYGLFYPDKVTPYAADELPLVRALHGEHSDDVEVFVRNPNVPEGLLISVTGRPVRNQADTATGGVVVFHDVTERRRAEEARLFLGAIVESSEDAILGLALDGTIMSWNRGAEHLYGYPRAEIVGKRIDLLLPAEQRHEFERIRDKILAGERVEHLETLRIHKSGQPVHVALTASPIRESADTVKGIATIARDISLQKQAEAQLKQAKEAAEMADQAKSAFLANMSHEIRTPLNGVIGMTGLLLNTALSPEQQRFTQTIRQSADTLLAVINDILDFSKIEAGRMDLEILDFDLTEVVENAANLLADQAMAKELELASQIEHGVPMRLQGDPFRIGQVLINLISNGIKFTDHGEVVVRARRLRETESEVMIRFEVRDTGVGISPEIQPRLFQPFSQADVSTTRKYGGTGLGLAISTQLVRLMGGSIGVKSEPGQGSTFWFELPLKKQPLLQESVTSLRTNLRGFRVLIIDDNPTNREILHDHILRWDMRNGTAESGPQGLAMMRAALERGEPYDIVILDMNMLGMDGLEVADAMQRDPRLASTKIVMLTSMGQRGLTDELRQAGIAACLPKPARQSELYNTLVAVMESSDTAAPMRPAISLKSTGQVRLWRDGPARILVVEDNLINQRVTSAILEAQGYQVDVVANGLEALHAVEVIPYDAILMDCQMPEMDGYQAASHIRSREGSDRHIPIIAMTANALQGEREKCLAAGMDDYLIKPAKPEEVYATLERWLPADDAEPKRQAEQLDASAPLELLDPDVLRSLRSLQAGSPGLFSQLIDLFLADTPAHLAGLRQLLAQGSSEQLVRLSHLLKGSCANMGARRMALLCANLEAAAHEGLAVQLAPLLGELEQAWELTHLALDAERLKG